MSVKQGYRQKDLKMKIKASPATTKPEHHYVKYFVNLLQLF